MPAFKQSPPEALTSSPSPRQIVAELDKYVVGQHRAKRAVAIALRNRLRRRQLPPDLAEEVAPKNILMIGPTGVGKTEIARRLARLTRSPSATGSAAAESRPSLPMRSRPRTSS